MSVLTFNNIGISAIAACVPKNKIRNLEATNYWDSELVARMVEKIGIYERREADNKTCSSDLAVAAAEKLFIDNHINKEDIDALIFVSQTPDYRMPATAFLLQHRLSLSQEIGVYDVNLSCTGFINGLFLAYSLLQNEGVNKVLLLNGETRTKVYSQKDKKGAFMFGDAGSAALIDKSEKYRSTFFSNVSDGEHAHLEMIHGGGYRNPSSAETLKERIMDEQGNIRNDEQVFGLGEDVMSLFMRVMPRNIKSLMDYSGISPEAIDYFVIHEGSRYLSSFIRKKLKLPEEKTPSILATFGNTASVSIPLIIISELKNKMDGEKALLMAAMGAGMNWASAIINTVDCNVSDLVEL